jgi:hypothetical protein
MFNPIFFNVLTKSRMRPLMSSMSTRVNYEPAMIRSRMSRNFSSSEKLVHWSSLEKEIRTSLYLRGFCVAGSPERISRRVRFYAHFKGKLPSTPKMTLMKFFGSSSLEPPTCHPRRHPRDPSAFHLEVGVER